jgi:hypothetical protein
MDVGGQGHAPAALPPGKTRYRLYSENQVDINYVFIPSIICTLSCPNGIQNSARHYLKFVQICIQNCIHFVILYPKLGLGDKVRVTILMCIGTCIVVISEEEEPTRCYLVFYCTYERLNTIRAALCPSSGAKRPGRSLQPGHLASQPAPNHQPAAT